MLTLVTFPTVTRTRAHIEDVVVDGAARGHGVGSALLREAERLARDAGAMAYLVAFNQRALVRGVAVVDAPIPVRAQVPSNDPVERLAIYSAAAARSQLAAGIKAGLKRLTDAKYPVTEIGLGCRLCERENCRQRAFPPLQHRLMIDERVKGPSAYPFKAIS